MSISLNDHERRIKDFEGKIVEIGNRITAVENKPGAAVVSLTNWSQSGRDFLFPIPNEYLSHKFAVLAINIRCRENQVGNAYPRIESSVNSVTFRSGGLDNNNRGYITVTATKSGNNIALRSEPYRIEKPYGPLIVIFYK